MIANPLTNVVNKVFGRPSAVPTVPVLPQRHSSGQHGIVADSGTLADGMVAICAASIQGLSHRSAAGSRQDSYSFAAEGTRIACAVADGLGSAPLSHLGSEAAARTAATVAITGGGHAETAAGVSAALRIIADQINQPVDLLATTLATLVVEVGAPDDSWTVAVTEWGDTRATVYRPGVIVDGHPDWRRLADSCSNDEVFANSVNPLPHCPHPRAQGLYEWKPGEMLLLATDGIDAQLVASNPVGHGLAGAWEQSPSIWQFIADVGFDRAGARDDRTAICLWRAGESPQSPAELQKRRTAKSRSNGSLKRPPSQDVGGQGSVFQDDPGAHRADFNAGGRTQLPGQQEADAGGA